MLATLENELLEKNSKGHPAQGESTGQENIQVSDVGPTETRELSSARHCGDPWDLDPVPLLLA